MKDRVRFRFFGLYVCISRYAFHVRRRSLNRGAQNGHRLRNERMAIAGNKCELCGANLPAYGTLVHLLEKGDPNRKKVENVRVVCRDCFHKENRQDWQLAFERKGGEA